MSSPLNKRPFEAYRGDAPYAFVSYAHRDSQTVYPELARLKKLGFNVWYDEGISPGSHWSDELAERINNCALFLFMVTPRSVASRNCLDEANYVLDSDTPFLAVHLEETELPPGLKLRMGSRQAILRYELEPLSYESKLYAAVAAHAATPGQAKTDVAQGFQLGSYKVEPLRGAVTGPGDETHHLEPKVMDVFACLARRPNELITRDELLEAVWTGQVAADELLTRAVSELRRALGGAKFIETVPKRGYRLMGDVLPLEHSKTESSEERARPAAFPVGRKWAYAVAGVVALAMVMLTADRFFPDTAREPVSLGNDCSVTAAAPSTANVKHSIAVLPFENLSGDSEHFVDGIHDDVIKTLARIGALKVTSRPSVMQYKGERKPLPVIADELNVSLVVAGTVKRDGDQVQVSPQLIDALTGQVLWVESFDRQLTNIFALQSDIARAISDAIRIELTPVDRANLADTRPVVPAAYDAYLRGSYVMNKGVSGETLSAVSYLEESIEADPTFAPAYAALVQAYVNDLFFITDPQERQEWTTKARVAVDKAIGLDRCMAEAHVARADLEAYLWNWDAAHNAYRRAIDLNPNLEFAYRRYALFLASLGHLDEALHHMKKAQQLAPLSPPVNQSLGWIYLYRAEYDKAIDQFELVLEMDPDLGNVRTNLRWVYADAGMVEQLIPNDSEDLDCGGLLQLAWAYAARGQDKFAEDAYRDSVEQCPLGEEGGAEEAGAVYVFGHDEEKALEMLRRLFEKRQGTLEALLPHWDPLREHPEFVELMKKSGLDKAAKPFSETHKRASSQ